MPRPLRILGMGGSLDGGRSARLTLEQVLAATAPHGAETTLFDLKTRDVPLYVYGQAPTDDVATFIDAVRQADALIWVSPLYHGSVSGAFKNLVDWLELTAKDDPPYLTDKVVALACVAGGTQAMQGVNAMEQMVRALRGITLPLVLPVERSYQVFGPDGQPMDPKTTEQITRMATELVRVADRLRGGR